MIPTPAEHMSVVNGKNCPYFNGRREDYQSYLGAVAMWLRIAEPEEDNLAFHLASRMGGLAKTIAQGIPHILLGAATPEDVAARHTGREVGLQNQTITTGVFHLFSVLNASGYRRQPHMHTVNVISEFFNHKRLRGQTMMEYTVSFEQTWARASDAGATLDPISLAFLMMIRSGLDEEDYSKVITYAGPVNNVTLLLMSGALATVFGSHMTKESGDAAGSEVFQAEGVLDIGSDEFDVIESELDGDGNEVFVSRHFVKQPTRQQTYPRTTQSGSSWTRHPKPATASRTFKPTEVHCYKCGNKGHFARNCGACFVCGEIGHIARDCNKQPGSYLVSFSHTLHAIIDTACTCTVMGSTMLETIRRTHPDISIISQHSQSMFKFGRDDRKASIRVWIPIQVLGNQGYLVSEVIADQNGETPLPLLLSKSTCKRLEIVINIATDEGSVMGVKHRFESSKRGHYVLPFSLSSHIIQAESGESQVFHVITDVDDLLPQSDKSIRQEIEKLHLRYGHPSSVALREHLELAGVLMDRNVTACINKVSDACITCKQFGRPKSPSRTSMPLSKTFNDIVAVDIMTVEGSPVAKFICIFSRFVILVRLKNKEAVTFLNAFEENWVKYFGPPRGILSDKGGESSSAITLEYRESMGISSLFTASESPESNAICERLGLIVRETVGKLRVDHPHLALEILLAKTSMAHNQMANVNGFSPCQATFGVNPRVPTILDATLSAHSNAEIQGDSYVNRVLLIHKAREAYSEAEHSTRLHKALNMKQNHDTMRVYQPGELVYFWDRKVGHSSGWRGPASVLGCNPAAREVALIYGKQTYSRHYSKVKPAGKIQSKQLSEISDRIPLREDAPVPQQWIMEEGSPNIDPTPQEIGSSGPPLMTTEELAHDQPDSPSHNDDDSSEENSSDESSGSERTNPNDRDEYQPSLTSSVSSDEVDPKPQVATVTVPHTRPPMDPSATWKQDNRHVDAWKTHTNGEDVVGTRHRQKISYKNMERRDSKMVEHFRRPKFRKFRTPHLVLVAEISATKPDHRSPDFIVAKQREIQSFFDHGVVQLIKKDICPESTTLINMKWVVKYKTMATGEAGLTVSEPKARLVGLGFQETLEDWEVVDSPTATKESHRLLMLAALRENWRVGSLDVASAFLQADVRTEDQKSIALIPPKEANVPEGYVWLLLKSLYGLRSAPADWWRTFSKSLKALGMEQSKHDIALFTYRISGKLEGALTVHVDDILVAGSEIFLKQVIEPLRSKFKFSKAEWDSFVHVGLTIKREKSIIMIDQKTYIESLAEMELGAEGENLERKLDQKEHSTFREKVGSLMWISSSTRPDVAVDVSSMARNLNTPTVRNVKHANKIIRYLLHTKDQPLVMITPSHTSEIIAFTDSAFQNIEDGGTQGGNVILISSGREGGAIVSWKSNKVKRVVRSTFAAETIQCSATFDQASWIRLLWDDLSSRDQITKLHIKTDCKSLTEHLETLSGAATEKRLRGELFILKEALATKEVDSISHVSSTLQLADGMTKSNHTTKKAIIHAMNGHTL